MFAYNNDKGDGYVIKEVELIKKPQLNEQVFKQNGIVVMESLNYTLPVRLTFWKIGKYITNIGIVAEVDRQMI